MMKKINKKIKNFVVTCIQYTLECGNPVTLSITNGVQLSGLLGSYDVGHILVYECSESYGIRILPETSCQSNFIWSLDFADGLLSCTRSMLILIS